MKVTKSVRLDESLVKQVEAKGPFSYVVRIAVHDYLDKDSVTNHVNFMLLRQKEAIEELLFNQQANEVLLHFLIRYFFGHFPYFPKEGEPPKETDGLNRYKAFEAAFSKYLEKEGPSNLFLSLVARYMEEQDS